MPDDQNPSGGGNPPQNPPQNPTAPAPPIAPPLRPPPARATEPAPVTPRDRSRLAPRRRPLPARPDRTPLGAIPPVPTRADGRPVLEADRLRQHLRARASKMQADLAKAATKKIAPARK